MKKNKHIIYCILFLFLGFVSCAEENPGADWAPSLRGHYLNISKTSFYFGSKTKDPQKTYISSFTTSWAFRDYASWIQITPASGNDYDIVEVQVDENLSGDNTRTSVFSFLSTDSDYNYKETMFVSQDYAIPFITPAVTSLLVPGATYSQNIAISSNLAWKCTSSADWLKCSVAPDSTSFTLSVTENTTGAPRTATLTFTGTKNTSVSTTLTVVQAAAKMEEGDSTLIFYDTGGTYQFKIHSEAAWTATTKQSWIQIQPNQGEAGETTVSISATPNASIKERIGYVVFKIGTTQAIQIKVQQKGLYLSTTVSQLGFTSFATSQSLTVLSNTNWTVQSKPEWVTITPTSGNDNQQLSVAVTNNPNTTTRSGEIVIAKPFTTLQAKVQISQAGKTFDPSVFTTLHFTDKVSTDSLSFTTDGAWTASSPQTWIGVTPASGNGNGKIFVTVQENTSDNPRTGEVAVTVGQTTHTALVQQEGKYFTVSSGVTATLPSTKSTHSVSFATNDAWKATSASSWITLSPSSGTGSSTVAIQAADNPSINARKDTTFITPTHAQGIKVITTQAARYLKLNQSSVSFFAAGGTSSPITISTDATYTITCSNTWFTVQQTDNTFTVTATEHEEKTPREGIITIKMTGLVAGESYELQLPVIQYGEGTVFTIQPFTEDQYWNPVKGTGATFTVTGFGTEMNWNPSGTSSLQVIINGYPADENWNF